MHVILLSIRSRQLGPRNWVGFPALLVVVGIVNGNEMHIIHGFVDCHEGSRSGHGGGGAESQGVCACEPALAFSSMKPCREH
jgi:hypothetical protein